MMEELTRRVDLVEESCRRLGRQNCWLKLAVVVLPLVALVAGAVGSQDITARSVTAERLVIKDTQGRNRVVVETKKPGTTFEMLDPNGARRISLNVLDNGSALIYQHYPDGKMFSFGLMTPGSEGKGFPNFTFRGPDGAVYATLNHKTPASPPSFEIYAGDREPNAPIGKLGGTRP
jgi:hypothetical protein